MQQIQQSVIMLKSLSTQNMHFIVQSLTLGVCVHIHIVLKTEHFSVLTLNWVLRVNEYDL